MATRSRIGIELEDGAIRSIYCHWDGYPSGVGATLTVHYTQREKVLELISLGDISSLDAEVSPNGPHSFDKPQAGVTVAYHRDRGEKLSPARYDPNRNHFIQRGFEEYGYVFTKENKWEIFK
jgi:hypothetical protein